MEGEVATRDAVAVRKLAVQFVLQPRGELSSHSPPRRFVFDAVDERGALCVVFPGLESMRVVPVWERALNLPVAELPARLHVVVLGHPPQCKGTGANAEDDPVAFLDAFGLFQSNGCPWGHESLEGAGTAVPFENGGCRGIDRRGNLYDGHGCGGHVE